MLATGALEATRLLLASRDVHPAGLGNTRGLVGRHYMCHIAGTIGTLRNNGRPMMYGKAMSVLTTVSIAGGALPFRNLRSAAKLSATQCSACTIRAYPIRSTARERCRPSFWHSGSSATNTASDSSTHEPVSARMWFQHAANAGIDAFGTARFLRHWVRDRVLAERKFPTVIIRPRKNLFSLEFIPNRRLIGTAMSGWPEDDPLGMPVLHVDWRYSEMDVRTVDIAFQLLQRELARSGLGELTREPDELDVEAVIRRDGAYGGHHIGTLRMGRDSGTGVVDGDCRVFDVPNLYSVQGVFFPTSGQANPTLTIVALAIRLAHHIKADLARHVEILTRRQTRPVCLRLMSLWPRRRPSIGHEFGSSLEPVALGSPHDRGMVALERSQFGDAPGVLGIAALAAATHRLGVARAALIAGAAPSRVAAGDLSSSVSAR